MEIKQAFSSQRKLLIFGFFLMAYGSVFAAECSSRTEMLRVGDSEKQVMQIMDQKPTKITRSETAGIEKSTLVFESGTTVCSLSLVFGRLVSKQVEQQKPGWLPGFLSH